EGDAGLDLLLDAADADHEELVQVGAEDGQELEALQKGHLRVLGLFEYAAVELQPAQLPVEVQRRIFPSRHALRHNLHTLLRHPPCDLASQSAILPDRAGRGEKKK